MLRTSFPTNLNRDRLSTILKDDNSSLTTVNDLYEKDLIVYGTTWIAWVQIFNVILVNSASSLMWASASSAPVVVSEWMQVNYTALNWLSNLSAVINTICSLLTGWSYQRFGIKANILFAAVMNFVGCWIRCIAIIVPEHHRYTVMMVGQFVASIGGAFVYNISAKLASVWFAPQHRGVANILATLSVGMAMAPVLIPFLCPTPDKVSSMLIIVSIISTVCAIPSVFLPSQPRIPSSPSAEQDRMGFKEAIQCLWKNPSFIWVTILCAANGGMVFSVATLIIEAISPFGYTDLESGFCATASVVAGFAGGILSGYWAGKTAQHLMLIKIFTPIMLFTYLMLIFEMIPNAFSVVLIACVLNGFFAYGLLPIHLELACELSYPVPESVSSSILWLITTAATLVFSVAIDALRAGPEADPPNNMNLAMIIVCVIVTVGSLPSIWLKGDLKRTAFDNEALQQEKTIK
ncbi:major facilitator superfamily domain-containing protein [Thamnidium elegans]|nr:major facilitator superfamily domain-containing protein [Thamnidium elegans]